jgi:hypothetical protein
VLSSLHPSDKEVGVIVTLCTGHRHLSCLLCRLFRRRYNTSKRLSSKDLALPNYRCLKHMWTLSTVKVKVKV